MIEVSELQRKNLLEAKEMWDSVPEKNVISGLKDFRAERRLVAMREAPTCNTLACFGGWCAWWPAFQAQGVIVSFSGGPHVRNHDCTSTFLFGHPNLFARRGDYLIDRFTNDSSDWKIIMNRLNWVIKHSEVQTEVEHKELLY